MSFCNVLLMCEKHNTSSILVKIMDLIQLSSRMPTLKAVVSLNVTNRYGSGLNFAMNQTSWSCARIVHYASSILVKIVHLS